MIEIKNNFLASKMNKDIDARLLPKNQYRHAENLEINRSENSDAGTVQNILGNKELKNFRALTGIFDLDCIGAYANPATDSLYLFFTNNTESGYNNTAANYIYEYNTLGATTMLVTGPFLNFSKKSKILAINVLENFLFWTDNRNQPRKINITSAIGNPSYYYSEDQISIAKPSPLYPPNLYKESALASTPSVKKYETTLYNVSSPEVIQGVPNPYYDVNYIGDSAYLEDKFVRFSYRYKFDDGEYSIMAPFTQIAYIPKQDGYFLNKLTESDEEAAYRSTIVSFMQNKVDQIKLQIVLPEIVISAGGAVINCPARLFSERFNIESIEILYKDANDINVSVVDSIPVAPIPGSFWDTGASVYEYIYNSKKPFKTLPTKDSTRVNDIVPIKALCQEIISNRVVYSNYQNKASYPKYLNYNVGYGDKSNFVNDSSKTSIIEYPNHSLKENRNYQVGVVLADRFGRESGVILSSAVSSSLSQFGASSLYVKYRDETSTVPAFYPGIALKVLFNDAISSNIAGWPGIYNGNPASDDYNPLGWYSYKIVVKQTEQDYYNVYLPGFMEAYPDNPSLEFNSTSHVVLINDNINKVPRDLTEVGPAQLQFRSSVNLYPRVINNTAPWLNNQAYPGNTFSFVSTIATNNSLFFPNNLVPIGGLPAGYDKFYQIDSDPLIARLSVPTSLGVTSSEDVINLSISETKPFESKLDIYWETSTVGLISELNQAIEESSTGATQMDASPFSLSEGGSGTRTVIDSLTFKNAAGADVILSPTELAIQNVVNGYGNSLTSRFQLQPTSTPGKFRIVTTGDGLFVYEGAPSSNTFTFNLVSGSGTPLIYSYYQIPNCVLTNVPPTIESPDAGGFYQFNAGTGLNAITSCTGINGSFDVASNQIGLSWSISASAPGFTITTDGGFLTVNTNVCPRGTHFVSITLKDTNGGVGAESDTVSITVTIN
jgi:hypothetical protein